MPPDTDWTDVLPPVDDRPQHAAVPHRRALADAWHQVNIYGSLALWTWAVLTAGGLLALVDWALWRAR